MSFSFHHSLSLPFFTPLYQLDPHLTANLSLSRCSPATAWQPLSGNQSGATRGWWERYATAKKPSEVTYLQSRQSPPDPLPTLPLFLLTSFCLMFERAFIPQILSALMNNTWASVANPHPTLSALSNTHKHSASYLLCTLHPQMAWPRSFPLWMQDNWICRSVVFCCPDRSV